MNLIDRINKFENGDCTVREFNKIFKSKIVGFSDNLQVEIGNIHDTDTTRLLIIGKANIKHNFYSKCRENKHT
jgi:hypothetical protein